MFDACLGSAGSPGRDRLCAAKVIAEIACNPKARDWLHKGAAFSEHKFAFVDTGNAQLCDRIMDHVV